MVKRQIGTIIKNILEVSMKSVTLAVVLTAGAVLEGCSEMTGVMNDLQTMTISNLPKQGIAQPTNKTVVSS